jgi:hypothetical protein
MRKQIKFICDAFNITEEELRDCKNKNASLARGMLCAYLYRYKGFTLVKLSEMLCYSRHSGVAYALHSHKLRLKQKRKNKYKRLFNELKRIPLNEKEINQL